MRHIDVISLPQTWEMTDRREKKVNSDINYWIVITGNGGWEETVNVFSQVLDWR